MLIVNTLPLCLKMPNTVGLAVLLPGLACPEPVLNRVGLIHLDDIQEYQLLFTILGDAFVGMMY